MAGQRCSSTGVPAATPTPKPAIKPARQTWRRPHCAPALHLVFRRFLIRINCLARLPVRQNLIQNLSAASCVSGSSSRFRPRVPLPVDVFCQGVHFTFYHPPLSHLSKHVGGTQPSWHFPPLSHQSNTQLPSSWTTPVVVRDLYPGSSARKEEQICFLCNLTIPWDVGDKP